MTAITAARASRPRALRIALFDSRQKIGAKILISGGTRCNVTNAQVRASDYHGGPSHFIRHALEAFDPRRTRDFFEGIGVPLELEPSGKYFPVTHSGRTVLEALLGEVRELGVELRTGAPVTSLEARDGTFRLAGLSGDELLTARRAVLATGGLSLPETGSDGTGLRLAASLGHHIVRTVPALSPLLGDDAGFRSLSGLTLEARLSFFAGDRKRAETRGGFLFTHFGYSGPSALDLSRHVAGAAASETPRVEASFAPDDDESSLGRRWQAFRAAHPDRFVRSFFTDGLGVPARLADLFLEKAGVGARETVSRRKERDVRRLLHAFLHVDLRVTGVFGYRKAEATAGGVDLKEVNVSTMESKKVPGLHFAGEILDVDGRIGGFNFQWAWSTGAIAGAAAARCLLQG